LDFQGFRQSLSSDAGTRAKRDAGECQMATAAEMMFFSGAPLKNIISAEHSTPLS
jgi:hypothetical protein